MKRTRSLKKPFLGLDTTITNESVESTGIVRQQGSEYELSDRRKQELSLSLAKGLLDEKLNITNNDVELLVKEIGDITEDESVRIVRQSIENHRHDPNFSRHGLETLEELIDENSGVENRIHNLKVEAALLQHYAPYPEVRAVTDPSDDPSTPVETVRAYLIGIVLVIISSGVNQFFQPRLPPINVSASLLQLLAYPLGRIFAAFVPDWGVIIGTKRISLNPCPWNYKEQTFVTLMISITAPLAYVNSQIFVQRLDVYYGHKWADAGYQALLLLSTQFIGCGLAGLVSHVLVYPVECIWPANFPVLALNRALIHPDRREVINGWSMSRHKLFYLSFLAMFVYFWFPNYLFQALSMFNWMTWISPQNFALAAITGSVSGLGLNPIPTFDWNIIDSLMSPLSTPWFANLSNYIGVFICGAVVIPAVYWTNKFHTAYLPINSNEIFDNRGQPYTVANILTNGKFDIDKYQAYSPPYYTAANLVTYGAFFALYPAMIVDTGLRRWKMIRQGAVKIWQAITSRASILHSYSDAHSKMMRAYREIPLWWYGVVFFVSFALAIVCVEIYPTETPVWGIVLAIVIAAVFLMPIGIIAATTGVFLSLNVLTELIAGYIWPGNPMASMTIKAFGVNTNLQAISFISNQKLAHYAKLPPRSAFRAQIVAALVQIVVMLGVINWQMAHYEGICEPQQPDRFTCPGQTIYYSASIIWGVIGPRRVFSHLYPVLQWCFLIGVFLPIPFYLLEQRYPRSFWRNLKPLLIIAGFVTYAPFNMSFYTPSLYVSALFMVYIKKRYQAWFEKYTYVLASGLSAGIALAAIIIFFAVQYDAKNLIWWGNTVPYAGVDGGNPAFQLTLLPLPEQGYFGPDPGTFPA
ncbi:oligopeptide transporter 2 [Trichomonascus vanleenenianus]|uniref:oligopeptide transporter 2 n=1 Tax=Trichomonascus vanleenenianus TaxID=2268995 RepID=UPI003ECA49EA